MPAGDMDEMIEELQITAERVERFRGIHEDAVRDLRDKIAEARAAGCDHEDIDQAIRRARESVKRFARMPGAADVLGFGALAADANGNGAPSA
jgi:hypothetical protein